MLKSILELTLQDMQLFTIGTITHLFVIIFEHRVIIYPGFSRRNLLARARDFEVNRRHLNRSPSAICVSGYIVSCCLIASDVKKANCLHCIVGIASAAQQTTACCISFETKCVCFVFNVRTVIFVKSDENVSTSRPIKAKLNYSSYIGHIYCE